MAEHIPSERSEAQDTSSMLWAQEACACTWVAKVSWSSAVQTLLSLGEPSSTGASVIEVVAGASGDGSSYAKYFAPAELGQLLELERRALVHAKAHDAL